MAATAKVVNEAENRENRLIDRWILDYFIYQCYTKLKTSYSICSTAVHHLNGCVQVEGHESTPDQTGSRSKRLIGVLMICLSRAQKIDDSYWDVYAEKGLTLLEICVEIINHLRALCPELNTLQSTELIINVKRLAVCVCALAKKTDIAKEVLRRQFTQDNSTLAQAKTEVELKRAISSKAPGAYLRDVDIETVVKMIVNWLAPYFAKYRTPYLFKAARNTVLNIDDAAAFSGDADLTQDPDSERPEASTSSPDKNVTDRVRSPARRTKNTVNKTPDQAAKAMKSPMKKTPIVADDMAVSPSSEPATPSQQVRRTTPAKRGTTSSSRKGDSPVKRAKVTPSGGKRRSEEPARSPEAKNKACRRLLVNSQQQWDFLDESFSEDEPPPVRLGRRPIRDRRGSRDEDDRAGRDEDDRSGRDQEKDGLTPAEQLLKLVELRNTQRNPSSATTKNATQPSTGATKSPVQAASTSKTRGPAEVATSSPNKNKPTTSKYPAVTNSPKPLSPAPKRRAEKRPARDSSDEEIDVIMNSDTTDSMRNSAQVKSTKRRKWTWEESRNLLRGVLKFGDGNWLKILQHFKFQNRNNVHLKDRWRIMTKYSDIPDLKSEYSVS